MIDRLTDINYVHDALRERLPRNWSLDRKEAPANDGTLSAMYRWHRWTDGNEVVVQVHEDYAHQTGDVERLCNQLMEAVVESMGPVQWFMFQRLVPHA